MCRNRKLPWNQIWNSSICDHTMRFVHTQISAVGFRIVESNPIRLELLTTLIDQTIQAQAKHLALPAGYLTARSEAEMHEQITTVSNLANDAGIAIIGGIDSETEVDKRKHNISDLISKGKLPFWGFAVGTTQSTNCNNHIWRQTSTTSTNKKFTPKAKIAGLDRIVTIDNFRIGVLICGELFNQDVRGNVSHGRPNLVVHIGHLSMRRFTQSMKVVTIEGNCPVCHSVHTQNPGKIHYVDRNGEKDSQSTKTNPLIKIGEMWAGWAVRNIK